MFPRRLVLAALLCSALASGARAAALEVQDDRGITVRLAAPPQRVVTLLPSLTETVCALGACNRLVGTDRYSNWPASVQALPKAGGLDDANVERIVSLKPDLVLAAGSARIIGRLESLGITVAALEAKSHADTQRVIRAVATLVGQPGADALWARIQQDTQAAAARVPPALKGQRVYMEVDASPYAAGPSSFIGETLQRLGLGNIVAPELGPFPKLNPEFVVRAQPDIVIASTRNLDEMATRPGWAQLAALKRGRVCRFASEQFEVLIRPGPRLGEAARLLADCLVRLPQ
ncbi:ABC transporter substrate-binding protein [Ideonella sp. BN130291]|uniref:ABC transporter substrate-binding protein n=1 Tax=Ideonella sp. BN130291 TaxID=3112940 RepID=UPI002E261DEB|nr:helical backbone metal receptor [Ideonella sp. BN130291]